MLDAKGLTEEEFLAQYSRKNYVKPSLTADVVILSKQDGCDSVLLVKRKNHPFIGQWALPGGFAAPDEEISRTAQRELAEETGVEGLPLRLAGVYSAPGRDPRGWVVSVVYVAQVEAERLRPVAGDDAAETAWFKIFRQENGLQLQNGTDAISHLAFDHDRILADALCIAGSGGL